ncbi:MAG: PDZ domain-containing protein [Armatimonadetes bacterium]|nr:PDZ domain-containing protein [Akkermansiaceae bacterium]
MTKFVCALVGLFLMGGICFSQEAKLIDLEKEILGEAWLGLAVSKPDDTTTTQLPSLPPGIGFVVTALDQGGPAEKAGVRKLDLLWKMDEQMLVNEGQLATLLRLAVPGDEVVVSVFREGKSLDLKVKLGLVKGDGGAIVRRMLSDSVLRTSEGALRMVNVEEKKAAFSNANGSAEVCRVINGDSVRIVDPKGKLIFEGVVNGKPELSAVPEGWRLQVSALRRGLDHALSAKAAPLRQPRPRIVPPAPKLEENEDPALIGKSENE